MNTRYEKAGNGCHTIVSPQEGFHIATAGKEINRIDYGGTPKKIRENEKELLAGTTGIPTEKIVFLDQVHGERIITLEDYPEKEEFSLGEADGIITGLPGTCLVIRTADCVPVFACDGGKKVLGASHSGWKGTQLEIAGGMVDKMRSVYGSRPEDISIFILPSIGPESYEVKEDVARHFSGYIREQSGKTYLDLWKHIKDSLVKRGIPEKKIFNSSLCTMKTNGDFFSHRKGDKGRNLNFGYIRG